MLVHLFGVDLDLSPIVAFWSPPGWQSYVNFLENSLDFLAESFGNAALAVVAFTIIVKTLLLPLTVQSIRSGKAMQELQPKIKELQKKYGKDRQRLSQETMKLYQQHRVNPMAGCLPMLIQIPIFFGLYRAISELSGGGGGASEYWSRSFLWIDNLDTADPIKLLPILAGAFQFVQTKMMRPANQGPISDPQQRMMNQMMTFMPIMVVIFGWGFASGPVIYWVTQSLYSVVQQWFITGWGSLHDWIPRLPELPEHRRLGYRPPRELDDVVVMSGEEGALPRQGGVMGWFQKRMEDAQKQAEARQAARSGSGSSSTSRSSSSSSSSSSSRTSSTSSKSKSYQERVDAGARREKQPRPVKKEAAQAAKRAAARPEPADDDETAGRQDGETAGAAANGPVTNGARRESVVPRKSRPVRKRTTRE